MFPNFIFHGRGSNPPSFSNLVTKYYFRISERPSVPKLYDFHPTYSRIFLNNESKNIDLLIFHWPQDVNWTYLKRSEDVLNIFWTSYVRSVYVLCLGGSLKDWNDVGTEDVKTESRQLQKCVVCYINLQQNDTNFNILSYTALSTRWHHITENIPSWLLWS